MRNKITVLGFILAFAFILIGCKQDSPSNEAKSDTPVTAEQADMARLIEVRKRLQKDIGEEEINTLLKKGYNLSKKLGNKQQEISFLMPLLRRISDRDERKDYLGRIIELIAQTGRTLPTQILVRGYTSTYTDDSEQSKEIHSLLKSPEKTSSEMLTEVAKSSMVDITKGLVKKDAQTYVDGCEAYALAFPDSTATPDYLLKGGEMAAELKTYGKTLELYDWVIDDYPKSEKVPIVLFLKGFLLDNELQDYPNAKATYQEFLQKYPDHHLVGDIRFLIDNLGKSIDEIRANQASEGQG